MVPPTEFLWHKMLLVDGPNHDPELIDFGQGAPGTCGKYARFPADTWGASAAFINRTVLVCGEWEACWSYDEFAGDWREAPAARMRLPRSNAAAVLLGESHWWVTGGRAAAGPGGAAAQLRSTEVLDAFGGFFLSVNLPGPLEQHSLVALGSDRFFLVGGKPLTAAAWIFDLRLQVKT